ncbi:MAG: helix-turn-helix transcriptional regulator [bacterium]|nr:helix-turn-helix transcriptional regulator [bacterium]
MSFGTDIKNMRESKRLTLRDVERETEISNAYLSQLESDKVKQPSPLMLYKLAQLYEVPYETLMEKVGYPIPKGNITIDKRSMSTQSRFGNLTKKEEQELLEYLDFLRSKKK